MANKYLNKMSRDLAKMFSAPKRRADTQRKDREEAKRNASEYGIEIEKIDDGFNVWPQRQIADTPLDCFAGDHFCNDWEEVNYMVTAYVVIAKSEGVKQ